MKTILILEDNEERIAGFERVVARLGEGYELKVWRDAPSMIAECEQYFLSAALISLDHDLNLQPLSAGRESIPLEWLDARERIGI